MLPKTNDFPAAAPKLAEIAFVARSVAVNFLPPEWLQLVLPAWELVTVPEVAIDKNGQFAFCKHQLGAPRECADVSAKSNAPESQLMSNQ